MQELNPELYPNLAKLNDNLKRVLRSDEAKGWDTLRKEYEICRRHPVYWMEEYGYILAGKLEGNQEGVEEIRFELNTTQLKDANKICSHFITRPWTRVQLLILKHRKAGISTLIAGFDYWLMRFMKNFNVFLIADLSSHTDNIAAMVELFHRRDKCGEGLKDASMRPPEKIALGGSKKGMKLSNGSMLELDSGENTNPGTSGTIQSCHMSESAKWRGEGITQETSLLNSIPRTGFVFVVKESTAFGLNKFAQDCESAERGESNWEFIFNTWRDLPDCEYKLGPDEELEYTQEEQELVRNYDLRPGHIKFRRSQIELLGSEQQFRQDFPLNSREPFLITGSNYFLTDSVDKRIEEISFYRDWKKKGWDYVMKEYPAIIQSLSRHPRGLKNALVTIEDRNVTPQLGMLTVNRGKVTCVFDKTKAKIDQGALTVFRLPERDRTYLLIIDVAEGIRSSEYVSDHSIFQVIDTFRREQVAEWGGVFDEETTAHYGVLAAKYYNNADIAPEMNNKCGGILRSELEKTGYRRFFQQEKITSSHRIQREFGWHTSRGNKQEVCGEFRLNFKNQDCTVHSIDLLKEMLFFIDNNGRLSASSGHTDDRVMAFSVGMKIIADTPSYRDRKKRIVKSDAELQVYPQYKDPFRQEQKQQEALRRYM